MDVGQARKGPTMLSAAEANRRYFRRSYETGVHGWAVEEPSPYAVTFLKRLARCVPGGSLLDVGCGEGRHAIAAAELGFKVTAIDYEPLALKRAKEFASRQGAKGIVFRKADVLNLPFAEGRFDVVLDYGCLHHQRRADWADYKANVLRVLRPGGFYVLSVFGPRFFLFHGGSRRWHIAQGAFRRRFERQDIAGLFSGDFEIVELKDERERSFWHALMRRRADPV